VLGDDVNPGSGDASTTHADPFAVLGMHKTADGLWVRAFIPYASAVRVVRTSSGKEVATLDRIDASGLFAGKVAGRKPFRYRLRVEGYDGRTVDLEDPYRFGPILGEIDMYLMAEGTHRALSDRLGAHPQKIDGVDGVAFAVWAPNAQRVAVVGDFNAWDGRRHPMRFRIEAGVWELFLPGVAVGARYKYEIVAQHGEVLPLKADPFAFAMEHPPATASIVERTGTHVWEDSEWMARRAAANSREAPISIYEVHLGSWKRAPANRYLTYRELAADLIPYAKAMGFTHIELLPVAEHPFDGSWGYQTIGLFAPSRRFGPPEDFAHFVDCAHAADLGVIVDWVPGHFPNDAHGLVWFDGTHLYEHADPRQGFQPAWHTLIYNFGRREVANFLVNNALFWLDAYHVDGLRVDAVASMLYLDFGRAPGEWLPNKYGGNENLAAVEFLKRTNTLTYAAQPGIATFAEESSTWPKVSGPTSDGGLGFGYKWNMGWMHDTLDYMAEDPIFRKHQHAKITFGLMYAWEENFVLPLSHDAVVHLKRSLLGRMPGDDWQRFANLRAYYGLMWTQPGKKLLFMGGEFAQEREWNHDRSLDWHLLEDPRRRGVQELVRDLNRLYAQTPALFELDCEPAGFEWIDADNSEQSVFTYVRRSRAGDFVVVAVNFTPVVRHGFRIGVPAPGKFRELLNTDALRYGGSGVVNEGAFASEEVPAHGRPQSIVLTLPPLGMFVLAHEAA
jgi:1,4-alpha-glucan branching enzyme